MPSVDATNRKVDLKRFFATLPEPLQGFPVEVEITEPSTVHHLRNVMRLKPGELVVMVDDWREVAYEAEIKEINKTSVTVSAERFSAVSAVPLPYVTLAVALIKEQRWDWLLQKVTELGVRAIQPLTTERTVVRLYGADVSKKLSRWRTIMRSAAEQSEGLFIPQLMKPLSVKSFCQGKQPGQLKLLLAERGENRVALKMALSTIRPGQPIVFAIGPEGGWSDEETACLEQAGFVPVSLGQRILRSETAAMSAMAAVVYETLR